MNNLLTTIPKSRFKTFALAERILQRCDGETNYGKEGSEWLWFIRTAHPPKKPVEDSVCFMIYDGKVRGYFHIIETSTIEKYSEMGYEFEDKPTPYIVVMAHWHMLPASEQVPMKGFQGWRYTHLRP